MSNVKISALPTGTIANTDTVPVVKAGVTTAVTFGHTHPESDVTNLATDLAGKAASSHTHPESDITGLVTDISNLQATVGPLRTALNQSGWAWVNQGGASVSQGSGVVRLFLATEATENIRGRFVAAPATPYTITALVYPGFMTTSGHCIVGPAFREVSSTKIAYIGMTGNAGGAGPRIHVRRNTNPTTNAGGGFTSATFIPTSTPGVWYQISDDGTNTIYRFSFDGVNFVQAFSEPRGAGGLFTTAPDQVGTVIQNFGSLQDTYGSFLSWVIS